MKVLVVGGTGFLGRAVVAELLGRGHRGTALSHSRPLADDPADSPAHGPSGAGTAVVADAEQLGEDGWAARMGCLLAEPLGPLV
ncbi:NAD-dependent epimerase/dehydratase family protein [Kitasatospora sp. GP82]|uniref:NAD-dependent epimerase/dehydratase family protein n=1 Tax=Kitasatospora sp. GP82 TaxID=3035089 RepID=UPI0032AF9B47